MMMHAPELFRIVGGKLGTSELDGNNGAFTIPHPSTGVVLTVICSDGRDWEELGWPLPKWEHVSVSTSRRCPNWIEMCAVKNLFWDAEDVVMQFHPAQSNYVNFHPFTLHLWRAIGIELPMPPALAVGPRSKEDIEAMRKYKSAFL